MRRFAIALISFLLLNCAQAVPSVPDGAVDAVATYSRAMMSADCEVVARLSAVIARHPEARDVLCQAYKQWSQLGLIERLRAPTLSLSSGQDRLVAVPNSRIALSNGRPQITNSVYIVFSNDGGREWKVIDIACENLKDWIKGAYPAYDGHPTFSATVDFPEAAR